MMDPNSTAADNTTTYPDDDKCVLSTDPTARPLRLLFLAIIPFVVLENIFVTVAVVLYREKLKRNIIYLYVASGLAANVVFCMFTFYQNLNQAVGFQNSTAVRVYAFQRGNLLLHVHC